MSLSDVYMNAENGLWAEPEAESCPCRGGWFLSDLDTWHKCPYHWHGQPDPEDEEHNEPQTQGPTEPCPECSGRGIVPRGRYPRNGLCPICFGRGIIETEAARLDREMREMANPYTERANEACTVLVRMGVVKDANAFDAFFTEAFCEEFIDTQCSDTVRAQQRVEWRAYRKAGMTLWDRLCMSPGQWVNISARHQTERGWHQYKRETRWSRALAPFEVQMVSAALHAGHPDKCPGWTGVHGVLSGTRIEFHTTWDSSD